LFVGVAILGIMTDQHFMSKKTTAAATVKKPSHATYAPGNVAHMTLEVSQPKSVAEILVTKSDKTFSSVVNENNREREHKSSQAQIIYNAEDERVVEDKPVVKDKPVDKSIEAVTGNNADDFEVNELDIEPFKLASGNLKLPVINIGEKEIEPVVTNRRDQLNLLVNAALLQSYQILTVPSGAQSFQNFEFPSTFSLRSLGYKISLGVEKKGFQFMLHYSAFQQVYSYEVAGNDYVVKSVDKDDYTVIRQGTRVSQENKFSLLGLGINKQVHWGNSAVGKYYASAGLEYSQSLVKRQGIGWINAGIGKHFQLGKSTTLQVGPYAEFSPVKFSGSGDPFYYQPYRVGISAGLRLNR
jgi:hypothetical protein